MIRQKLFIGQNYLKGINNKKLLVVGHQKHATPDERIKFKGSDWRDYPNDNDNIEMLNELINGSCMKWGSKDRKSWLQFGKMLSGDLGFSLNPQQSAELFNSIAFCNYLQVPDFALERRQGPDKNEIYEYSKSVFVEYLNDIKPDKIIVWGKFAFEYISKLDTFDKNQCKIGDSDVLKINHPCIVETGGYDKMIRVIKDFLTK